MTSRLRAQHHQEVLAIGQLRRKRCGNRRNTLSSTSSTSKRARYKYPTPTRHLLPLRLYPTARYPRRRPVLHLRRISTSMHPKLSAGMRARRIRRRNPSTLRPAAISGDLTIQQLLALAPTRVPTLVPQVLELEQELAVVPGWTVLLPPARILVRQSRSSRSASSMCSVKTATTLSLDVRVKLFAVKMSRSLLLVQSRALEF